MIAMTNAKVALDSLKATRGRTVLTMLGIIIGVASISLVLTLGDSIKHALAEQTKSLGKNIVVVRPGRNQKGILSEKNIFHYSPLSQYATTTLTEQDLVKISQQPSVAAESPLMLINGNVSAKHRLGQGSILATNNDFATIMDFEVTDGQFLDGTTERDTVVVGKQLAVDLFGTDQAVGQQLDIRGRTHTVIGVLKSNKGPVGLNGIDINRAAIISLDDGKTFNQGIAQIQQINVAITPKTDPKLAVSQLTKSLTKSHSGQQDFSVLAGGDAAAISNDFYTTITTVTAIIAAISLLVGGIGIMNIMLVGVAERTKEIGIRKSLGASNRHILWQFLIEALMISVSGGLIGVVVAYGLAAFVGLLIGFVPIISWSALLVGFGLSVVVGVIFGLAPALRAAHKDPIESLRQQN